MQFPFHLFFDCLLAPASSINYSAFALTFCARAEPSSGVHSLDEDFLDVWQDGDWCCWFFLCFCASKKPLHDANWSVAQKHMSLSITDSHALLFP
jgi:hypothetical protein